MDGRTPFKCIMAIRPAQQGMFEMFFTPEPPEGSEAYVVTGASTTIHDFLRDFKKAFGNSDFDGKLLTREQCDEFMAAHKCSFRFQRLD